MKLSPYQSAVSSLLLPHTLQVMTTHLETTNSEEKLYLHTRLKLAAVTTGRRETHCCLGTPPRGSEDNQLGDT